jgi:hypothetical protein
VVQQGAGQPLVQRSPLSDEIRDSWTKTPTIEALLARLSETDVQTAQSGTDVDAETSRILATRADDLWVALRIRKGELGQTTGARGVKAAGKPLQRPIKVFFFQGSTDRRALVIAGVHGSEKQGIEVERSGSRSQDDATGAYHDRRAVVVSRQCYPLRDNGARRRDAHQSQLPESVAGT